MYDLSRFRLSDMVECEAALRTLGAGAGSMEEVAQRTVRWLYENLGNGIRAEPGCALVRFFKTHPFEALTPPLQAFARRMFGDAPEPPGLRCLTLLATAGDRPEWNAREQSRGHQAIPLPSEAIVERAPMISQLIQQLGLDLATVVRPNPSILIDVEQRQFNVFHVAEAAGSPHIPAQRDFVQPHGIRSVLGFGGLLTRGDLFAVVIFSKVPIGTAAAEMFRTAALAVKIAVLPFAAGPVFAETIGRSAAEQLGEADLLRAQTAALTQLLEVHEEAVAEQAHELEDALEFLAVASHELNNPLNVLRGKLQLLLEQARSGGSQAEPVVDGTAVAVRQTERLMRLVEELLDVSRITVGRLHLEIEDVDLSRLIPDIVERLRDTIEDAGCAITLHIQPQVIARCDRLRIEQVLVNLLSNALKYGGRCPIDVSVETEDRQATIMVRDRGPGIPLAEQQRIFERFVRVAPKGVGGLGLGLYITRQIVGQHGGRIRVESQPGTGAAFFVSLPLGRAESDTPV